MSLSLRGLIGKLRRPPPPAVYQYRGFAIPLDLLHMTGGFPENWDAMEGEHLGHYKAYAPVEPGHHVMEIGCGIGRDAFLMMDLLGPKGTYTGLDIIKPSIDWAQANIAAKRAGFKFVHVDVLSPLHNPNGKLQTADVALPARAGTIDRIVLFSVFTHMFEPDIIHYLKEFRRVLRRDGLVMASCFYIDDETRETAGPEPILTFQHAQGDGCFILTKDQPEGAVAYTKEAVDRMIAAAGLRLMRPVGRGRWNGRGDQWHGQDVLVLGPA